MTTEMIRDLSVLGHMLDYCIDIDDAIKQYGNDFKAFSDNRTFKHAVSMCIMQIGELINKLSKDFQGKHSEIEWRNIRGIRNFFAHGYWEMNEEKIWDTVQNNISDIKKLCTEVLNENKDLIDVCSFGPDEEKLNFEDVEDMEL